MAKSTIEQFFHDFEETSNNFDANKSATQFSETFMHADPEGVHAIPRDAFIASLQKRKAFFDRLGLQSTQLTLINESELNPDYIIAKVLVMMYFAKSDGQKVEVKQTASYIIKTQENTPQIVFYLNDQLLNDVLKEHGLV